jgi:plastocyanin
MMRWLRLVGAVFALGLLFTACSDDSGDDSSSDTTAADDGGGEASGTDVTIADFAFDPGDLTVSAGDTVTWTNDDGTEHTVTSDDDAFDSGDISGGDTFEQTFDEAGEFAYHCSIHSQMSGTITVE